jgi:ribonuclease-3
MKQPGSAVDCKTRLQHFIQEDYTSHTYRYTELGKTGPDHDPQFCMGVLLDEELIAKGYGSSKKKAEEEAARIALQYFNLEPQDK